MNNNIATYMYNTSTPFIFMGNDHIISNLLFIIIVIGLPYYAKNYLSEKKQNILGSSIGIIIALGYLSWLCLEIIGGTFDIKLHLPFHLCRTANLLIALALIFRSYLAYEIVFFWGLTVIHAIITPDITQGFPHFHFFRFWTTHQLMFIGIIYATFVYDIRPRKKSILISYITLLLFFMITVPVNILLNSNYFWICGKPPVPTILDYFGPWPWYIIVVMFLTLMHFYFFYYLIIFLLNKFSKKKHIK